MPLSADGIAMCQACVLKHKTKEKAPTEEVNNIGIDLAQNVLQLHGAVSDESVAFRKKLPRPQFTLAIPRPAFSPWLSLEAAMHRQRAISSP